MIKSIILPFLIVAIAGCRRIDDLESKKMQFDVMAIQQDDLAKDAQSTGDFTEMVKHQAKRDYYKQKAHTMQDSMFNERYKDTLTQ